MFRLDYFSLIKKTVNSTTNNKNDECHSKTSTK